MTNRLEADSKGAPPPDVARRAVERVFKEESAGIVASLIRVTNDFDLAEDAMQEALAVAMEAWATNGPPERPGAWITTTARRRAIDRLRRDRSFTEKRDAYETLLRMDAESSRVDPLRTLDGSRGFEDDRLHLIFTCCHPALNPEAQVGMAEGPAAGLPRSRETVQQSGGALLSGPAARGTRTLEGAA